MEWIIGLIVTLFAASAIYGWFHDKSKELKEDEYNRNLRQQLHDEKQKFEAAVADVTQQLTKRAELVGNLRREFAATYIGGRKWLAAFIAEADRTVDESIASSLKFKKRPALKASDEVSVARTERRAFKERVKFLEYQLKSYKEYFPFLDDYEELILDEAVPLSGTGSNVETLEEADPVLLYVPKNEYDRLSPGERNQIALDRYLTKSLSPAAIGRLYERYLGYTYERDGWKVDYHGIIEGYEDLGRDLICMKGNEVHIVQAKCWSSQKLIHEKHVFQLFGTTQLYLMNRRKSDLFGATVSPWFITTTKLSPVAKQAADWLKVQVKEGHSLSKDYPMIKCNINQASKTKIYHLPFDQQYDRTKITPALGEFYATTTAEAEAKGFRRAWRHSGPFAA